jgi:septum formation protein
MSRQVILASQSPQRRMLFEALGIPFETIPADLDELSIQDSDLVKRAEKVARAKAEAILKLHPESIIIAADTYLIFQGQALEKPTSLTHAAEMLRTQSSQTLFEVSGVCYLDPGYDINFSGSVSTAVTFRALSEPEITHFIEVNQEKVLTWSGAFSPAYPSGAHLIESITGSYNSFTYGFPVEVIIPLLKQSGVMV